MVASRSNVSQVARSASFSANGVPYDAVTPDRIIRPNRTPTRVPIQSYNKSVSRPQNPYLLPPSPRFLLPSAHLSSSASV